MKLDEPFHDRETEPGSLFGVLLGQGTAAEGRHHDRDLGFGDPRSRVVDRDILAALRGPARFQRHGAALRGELDGVRQEVQHHLPDGAFVGPDGRQIGLDRFRDRDLAFRCT